MPQNQQQLLLQGIPSLMLLVRRQQLLGSQLLMLWQLLVLQLWLHLLAFARLQLAELLRGLPLWLNQLLLFLLQEELEPQPVWPAPFVGLPQWMEEEL